MKAQFVATDLEYQETTYKCLECGAVDTDSSPPDHRPPVALNCHSCKSGYNKTLVDMQHQRLGMWPVGPVAEG